MLFSLLLVTLLAAEPAQIFQAPALPTFADAVQMADDGREEEALAAFRRLVSANPNDHDARIWIGRLHERMGHPDLGEAVYRSVVIEDDDNVDALVGLASTLLAQNAPGEAIEILERAEELAPRREDVLTLLARAHRRAGSPEQSILYYERVAAIIPSEQHQLSLEDARLPYLHRVEVRGFSEQFSGTAPDSRNGEIAVNYRLNERLRVFGRGEVQRKLGFREERGGGGVEWRWTRRTTLRTQLLVAPDTIVMPEADFLGEIAYMNGDATWTGAYRYFDFTGARVSVFSPAVAWPAADRLDLAVRYALSVTESSTLFGRDYGQSVHLLGAYQWRPRLSFLAGYAAGVEDFEHFSIDRIGDFRANTVSGGVRYNLPSLTGLIGTYEHQWRSGGVSMGRVTVALAQRF